VLRGRNVTHDEIAARFAATAGRRYHALLEGGAEEPLYLPPRDGRPARIRYTRDYAQSALHELAHWCIAGPARRTLVDYGYWYRPPPREPGEGARFLAVEARVQGLELLFARVASVRFHVSLDDPGTDPGDFEPAVQAAAHAWLGRSFSARTEAVFAALDGDWRARLSTAEPGAPHTMQAHRRLGVDG
jgi:elongation factor P hydroxylase